MSFLQKAKERAAEMAREAADATSRAAGAVSAKASDPGTQERLKGGLASAGKTTAAVASGAAHATGRAAGAVAAKAQDPATQARVKGGLVAAGKGAGDAARLAKKGARSIVERIDPTILADLIIKATALQERTNAGLRAKGSIYRVSEIQITAAIPPGVTFSIGRVDDRGEWQAADDRHSSELLLAEEVAGDAAPILALDGDAPGWATEEGEAETGQACEDGEAAAVGVAGGEEGEPRPGG